MRLSKVDELARIQADLRNCFTIRNNRKFAMHQLLNILPATTP